MTGLYGLLGGKLSHSMSPQIHSLIFKELNIDGSYLLFELGKEEVSNAIKGLKAIKAKGINVTIPHKITVLQELDEVSQEAIKLGAVNTICFREGKTLGYNTDYYGFGLTLKRNNIVIAGKIAVILGSGGVSKTVFYYLLDKGIKNIWIVVRDKYKEDINISWINQLSKEEAYLVKLIEYSDLVNLDKVDLLINCTPCGMYPASLNQAPVGIDILSKFSFVVDLIYNPEETLLLKNAKELNIKAVNGLYMLVAQAVVAEELWNGISLNKEFIDKIYQKIYSECYKKMEDLNEI
ncbi:MAG TPA: shikimate dehydrogenase [Clostridiaceae bacterium]